MIGVVSEKLRGLFESIMKKCSKGFSLIFPIADLPPGPFASANPDDPTWQTIAPWTDPLADRGAYGRPSFKVRLEDEYGSNIHFTAENDEPSGRALIAGEDAWETYSVACRVQLCGSQLGDMSEIRRDDGVFLTTAMAGIVFRMQTLRRYYYFCIEDNRRLILYRRKDDDWHVLQWRRVELPDTPVTLRVEVLDNTISASCPDLNIELKATDNFENIAHGMAGFRTLGESRLYELKIESTDEQAARNDSCVKKVRSRTERLGRDIPDAVHAYTWPLNGSKLIFCMDFARHGHNDLLWHNQHGIEARDWNSERIWRHPEHSMIFNQFCVKAGPLRPDGSRRLYCLVGERAPGEKAAPCAKPAQNNVADEILILDGATGETITRKELPLDPASPGSLTRWDFSAEVGFGTKDGEPDFMIRQWRIGIGNGGVDLWMYDRNGNLLWHTVTETVYGHHHAVHWWDIDRDGTPEIITGGVCLDPQGKIKWIYEGKDIVDRLDGAGHHTPHYDAVLCQATEDWPATDPLLIYIVGGAGVHIVDALTGSTRAVYPIGHAQGGVWCKVRDDLPGREALVHTRWGTYGILTLFSASGQKLWSIQPDYVGETTHGVQWTDGELQHIWANTSECGMGLYDGHGRLVKPLNALRKIFAGKTRHDVKACSLMIKPGGRHLLALVESDRMHVFKPEDY